MSGKVPVTSRQASDATSMSERFTRWRLRYVNERPFVFVLAFLLGIGSGVMAWALKSCIGLISELLTSTVRPSGPDWWLLPAPAVGVLIVVALRKWWWHGHIGHGVRLIKNKLRLHDYALPAQYIYSPLAATTITLGFGGSAGAEGPIAFSSAALGSNMARLFGLPRRTALLLLGCGAGAGIAAIFKAPLGGAFFVFECLKLSMGSFGVMVLCVATLSAGLTSMAFQGFTLDMVVNDVVRYDPQLLGWVILLGLFCGAYSLLYTWMMKGVEQCLGRIGNRWAKGALSGLLVGVLLVLFPSLYGEGFGVMHAVLNGNPSAMAFGTMLTGAEIDGATLLIISFCLILVKGFVTSLSYNGGGVTGEFAPTLFAGCFAGYFFGAGLNFLFGLNLPVMQLAFFGMAGVMAGAIRAPLMAMFIVVEMSSAYTLLLPLAVTATLSFGVVRIITADDFFSRSPDRANGLYRRWKTHRFLLFRRKQ